MNTNEHGQNRNDDVDYRQDDHGLLAASVFGELNEAEQQALEARLAQEPELRAQRDELVATAALVRNSFPAGESLPPALMSGLEQAAAAGGVASPRLTLVRSNWIRMAAGLTLLCAAAVAANEWLKEPEEGGRSDRLAALDTSSSVPSVQSEFTDETRAGLDRHSKNGKHGRATESAERPEGLGREQKELAKASGTLSDVPAGEPTEHGHRTDGPPVESESTRGLRSDATSIDSRAAGVHDSLAEPQSDSEAPAQSPGGAPQAGHGGHYQGPGDSAPPGGGGGGSKAAEGAFIGAVVVGGEKDARAREENSYGISGKASPPPATSPAPVTAERKKSKRKAHAPVAESAPVAPTATSPSTPGPGGPSTPGPGAPSSGAFAGDSEDAGEPGRFAHALGFDLEVEEVEFELADSDDFFLGHGQDRKRDYAGRRIYTSDELDALARQRTDRILHHCQPLPDERPNAMFFRFYGDNPFELAHLDALSTFGADVDTASYTLTRRYLRDGILPEKAQIRTEEFINYFKPDLAPPVADSKAPFAVYTELSTSRWGADRWSQNAADGHERAMLRVGVRGKVVSREERQPLQLTFVVDTSGSMEQGQRMELVKHALRLLLTELDARDSIAIVAFSNEARQVLPMTSAANRGLIETAIYGLNPGGGTNAEAGLRMGYEVAGLSLAPGNHSRVVLLSDGVANVGQTDQDRVNQDVRAQRERGIYLNTIGVGMGNHNDTFLEQLANKGDGLCNYVDDEREARRALVENFTGAFETIARDLKLQVEFDPGQVYRYRLLGYENRAIADADFRNDKVDAGEIGAGHQVVALYELELTGNASEQPLARVNVRWKAPTGAGRHPNEDVAAGEVSFAVEASSPTAWSSSSAGFRRDTCVAQYAEILRRSVHARGNSLDALIAEASKLDAQLQDPDFTEFVQMMRVSRQLIIDRAPRTSDLTDCIDALRRNRILRAQYLELRAGRNDELLADLSAQNAQLELRIRDLIRGELDQQLK